MSNLIVSFISGAGGGMIAWFVTDFLRKPFRAFFDLKKESLEVLARYSNVSARPKYVPPWPNDAVGAVGYPTSTPKLPPEEESRLKEAEVALRDCGIKFIAFAQAETSTLSLLRLLGYDPAKIGGSFIGFSNSIGQYGDDRAHFRKEVEQALKVHLN
jgi:hypothetical protein